MSKKMSIKTIAISAVTTLLIWGGFLYYQGRPDPEFAERYKITEEAFDSGLKGEYSSITKYSPNLTIAADTDSLNDTSFFIYYKNPKINRIIAIQGSGYEVTYVTNSNYDFIVDTLPSYDSLFEKMRDIED